MRYRAARYTAFRCYDCQKVNVFPTRTCDGRECVECGGRLIPVGECVKGVRSDKKASAQAYRRG